MVVSLYSVGLRAPLMYFKNKPSSKNVIHAYKYKFVYS